MQQKVLINEIFPSVQGEGPYIGYKQLFIRFAKCNLNCAYCDTDFSSKLYEYTIKSLTDEINKYPDINFISLTGGEPLTETKFLNEFLPVKGKKIYLETNGTLTENLKEIIDCIDVIASDVKLESCSGIKNLYNIHYDFIKTACDYGKEIFLKAVFDSNITEDEIKNTVKLAGEFDIELILQPRMQGKNIMVNADKMYRVFDEFSKKYQKVRLIPQVHKFIDVK